MMKRYRQLWSSIWELRADPTDQLLVSAIYFGLALLAFLRPVGQIFTQLQEMHITPDGIGAMFFFFSGLICKRIPLRLLYFLALLLPLIALVSFILWFVAVNPNTSFLTAIPATGFLVAIVKNSFTVKRVRRA